MSIKRKLAAAVLSLSAAGSVLAGSAMALAPAAAPAAAVAAASHARPAYLYDG